MKKHKKAPQTLARTRGNDKRNRSPLKDTKEKTILKHFLKGESLNRFEAEQLGDHCLHSTISHFINNCGLPFHKKLEKVKSRFGNTCVTRYWLDELGIKKAKRYLKKKSI